MAFIGKFTTVSSSLVWDGSKFVSESLDSIVHSRAADKAAEYLVLSNTASLSGERALALGPGLVSVDGGANGLFQLSASLTAGPGIVINPNGQTLEISSSLNVDASFVVLGGEPSMPNERVLTAGVGLGLLDNGPNGTVVLSASLLEGNFIDITTVGNSLEIAVHSASLIGALGEEFAHVSGAFVLAALDPELPEGRALAGGDGIALTDGGAGGNLTVELDAAAGPGIALNFNAGVAEISASLAAGDGIVINNNGGTLEISSSLTSADNAASYLVLNATASLDNERVFTPGLGIGFSDAGAGGALTVSASLVAGPGIILGTEGNSIAVSASIVDVVAGPGIAVNIVDGTAQVSSSFTMPVELVSANYAATADDLLIAVDSTGGAVEITLPAGATAGRKYIVKDKAGDAAENNITIVAAGGADIDGAASWILGIDFGSATFVFDGSDWMTI